MSLGILYLARLYGFIYNFIGIMIGSMINFWLARRYGETVVQAFVSQATYDKYISYLMMERNSNVSSFGH